MTDMKPAFMVNNIFPAYLAVGENFDIDSIPDKFAYVLDGEGWKLFKRNGVSTALINVSAVQGLVALKQHIDFTAEKLSLNLIRKVTAWFKAVYRKYQSEAVGYLYYREGEWDFVPPTQTTTGASADYESAPKKEGWQIVGTIHSHGSMSAFHSGTDDADEKFFDGVHITIGKVDSVPEYSCSIVVQGEREVVDPSILVDGMEPADAIPTNWLSAVKETAPRGFDQLFATRVDKLYMAYYKGDITEDQYHRDLAVIKKEEAEHRKKEQERLTKIQSSNGRVNGNGRIWPPKNGRPYNNRYAHQFGGEEFEQFEKDPLDFPPTEDDIEMVGVGMKGSKPKKNSKRSRKYGKGKK